jgi:hypothetical protein
MASNRRGSCGCYVRILSEGDKPLTDPDEIQINGGAAFDALNRALNEARRIFKEVDKTTFQPRGNRDCISALRVSVPDMTSVVNTTAGVKYGRGR